MTDRVPTPAGWSGFSVDRRHGLGNAAALARSWRVQQLALSKTVWAGVERGDQSLCAAN
jgi:hypothetical protein